MQESYTWKAFIILANIIIATRMFDADLPAEIS